MNLIWRLEVVQSFRLYQKQSHMAPGRGQSRNGTEARPHVFGPREHQAAFVSLSVLVHWKEYSEVVEGMDSGLPNFESHLGLE